MKKIFIALILIAIFNSCRKESCPTCPPPIEPDSTSHFYTWQIDTLGTWQSFACAVWGTSSNNVYVAGAFFNPNTITSGTSIMHWDGTKWKPEPFWVGSLYCIFGFNANDIWVGGHNGANAIIGHWNGSSWNQIALNSTVDIHRIWGTSSSNLYAVGGSGKIFHYDGNSWTEMTSGTTIFLSDIWGYDAETIYAVGYDDATGTGTLLFFDGTKWKILYERNYTTPVQPYGNTTTVWGCDTSNVYIYTSYGAYVGNLNGWNRLDLPNGGVRVLSIRGESKKNFFVVGGYGLIIHWNGKSFWRYNEFFTYSQGTGDILNSVWANKNSVFIVGRSQTAQGIVYRGSQ